MAETARSLFCFRLTCSCFRKITQLNYIFLSNISAIFEIFEIFMQRKKSVAEFNPDNISFVRKIAKWRF